MKKKSGSRNYVIRKKYLLLTTVMVIMGIVFLSLLNLNKILEEKKQEVHNGNIYNELDKVYEQRQLDGEVQIKQADVYLADESFEYLMPILNFQKMNVVMINDLYNLDSIPEESYIILSGNSLNDEKVFQQLVTLTKRGNYYFIVDLQNTELKSNDVKEFLGIATVGVQTHVEGIRILDGFWNDTILEEEEYSDTAVQLEIKAGRPVYITSYAKDYEEETVTPLLYRNIFEKAQIYVLNSSILHDFPQGIVRGIIAQTKEDYLYPIMNVSYLAVAPLPVLSQEYTEELKTEYFRSMKQLTEDILLPDIQFIASDFNQKITLFAKEYLQDPTAVVTPDYISDIEKLILKQNGELGIWITDQNKDKWKDWVEKYFQKKKVSSIMLDEAEEKINVFKGIVGYVNFDPENFLPIKIQEDRHVQHAITLLLNDDKGKMRLNYLSSLFGYGISSMGIDMEDILTGQGEKWNVVARDISENVKSFIGITKTILEPYTMEEATMQALSYDLMEPEIYYDESEIEVNISYFTEKASFMLKTEQTVKNVINGHARQVGEGYYIIEFNQKQGVIQLESEWQKYQEE